jgi:uncharacterized protein YceK
MRSCLALTVPLLLGVSGCGTIANMQGQTVVSIGGPFPAPTIPFGGVVQDAKVMAGIPFLGLAMVADLPFSIVGDLATLPWATAKCIAERHQANDGQDETDGKAAVTGARASASAGP